jgi:hypothetical protein
LFVDGNGAERNAGISINGIPAGHSDNDGNFRIRKESFVSTADVVSVTDGSSTAQSRVTGWMIKTVRAPKGAPAAPTPLSPANGANVLEPFAISWSAVSDPSGIVAYNWQVSTSPAFAPVTRLDSTDGQTLQETISGLPFGTYYWRVQAVSGAFEQGAWSQPVSFNVTGAGSGAPGTPTLGPTQGYSTFHPYESIRFHWSNVPDAVSYRLEVSTDPNFPIANLPPGVQTFWFDNIPEPNGGFALINEGNYYARVFAVDADNPEGIRSLPSNLIQFSVFYGNPLPAPPSLLSPADNATATFPITFQWTDVPNPQDSGYEIEIARDPQFLDVEYGFNQITPPHYTILSLTSGPKFWRIRSAQGNSTPELPALTDWSAVRAFNIPSTPPEMESISVANPTPGGGYNENVAIQLKTPAQAGGAVVSLTSSNPAVAPVPATLNIAAGVAWEQFFFQVGQVSEPTPVTITASLNGTSVSTTITVQSVTLQSVSTPFRMTGGVPLGVTLLLNTEAPPEGTIVALSSSSPAAMPPATVTVPAGSPSFQFTIPTRAVTTNTPVTITATLNGVSVVSTTTLTPQRPPASITLDPSTVHGIGGNSFATVFVGSPSNTDLTLPITNNHPEIVTMPTSVTIPAFASAGGFNISTTAVSAQTVVTISVSGAGVTRSANLTVNPGSPQELRFVAAASRKTHGSAGTFDIDLPLDAAPGVECRSSGGNHTLVLTFTNDVVSGNAIVSAGTGNVLGTPTFSGNTMTVNLTGVSNAQTVTLALSGVTDQTNQVLPDATLTAKFLVGDVNGNGAVTASDVSQAKAQAGQSVGSTTFRSDLNGNGTINATDVSLLKSNVGTAVP